MNTKPPSCTKCGSSRIAPILRGLPTDEALALRNRGKVALGGCLVFEGQPEWVCRECRHEWLDPDRPARAELDRLFAGVEQDEG